MSCHSESAEPQLFKEILSGCAGDSLDAKFEAARVVIADKIVEALCCPFGQEIQFGPVKYETRDAFLRALRELDEYLREALDQQDVYYAYQPVRNVCCGSSDVYLRR